MIALGEDAHLAFGGEVGATDKGECLVPSGSGFGVDEIEVELICAVYEVGDHVAGAGDAIARQEIPESVGASSAIERVGVARADQDVVPDITLEVVIAAPAVQGVVPSTAIEEVDA